MRINEDLTLDFDDREGWRPRRYAFLVDDTTLHRALAVAVVKTAVVLGAAPDRPADQPHWRRSWLYVRDPDGIAYEFFTAVP